MGPCKWPSGQQNDSFSTKTFSDEDSCIVKLMQTVYDIAKQELAKYESLIELLE